MTYEICEANICFYYWHPLVWDFCKEKGIILISLFVYNNCSFLTIVDWEYKSQHLAYSGSTKHSCFLPLPTQMIISPKSKEADIKKRIIYCGVIGVIILLGLSSRRYTTILPDFIVEHAGDTLWSAMIYLSIRLWFMRRSFKFALISSFFFCYLIEFSQFYQAPWIIEIRQTLMGALVLGHSFLAIDLLRYACGIMGAFWIEKYLCFTCSGKHY